MTHERVNPWSPTPSNPSSHGINCWLNRGSGGRFVYDGLVTTVDRWFREHRLRKRRFRFVGDHAVGFEGDVRLFVLSPSVNATEAPQVEP